MDKKVRNSQIVWFSICSIIILLNGHLALFPLFAASIFGYITHIVLTGLLIFINIHPDIVNKLQDKKLHHCAGGVFLLKLFLLTSVISIIIVLLNPHYTVKTVIWIFSIQFIMFWNGIIRTYLFSTQMGIKLRIIGAVCGLIPIVNLIILIKIIRIVDYEIEIESEK